MKIEHETVANMLGDLGLPSEHSTIGLQKLAGADNRFLKDLKLNVSGVLGSSNFSKKETSLLALSVAINEKHQALMTAFENMARNNEATDAEIAETYACTAIMNTNNVFYRFRHYMHENEFYNKQPAGLRMSSMMNPIMGKEFFEMMSLVVSALNGCERCVTSHEHSVKQHGATEQRIYDAIRLASVIKSLCVIA
jgi:alkyl hydroperoxide reductase subunit D